MDYATKVGSRDMMKREICKKQSAFVTAKFQLICLSGYDTFYFAKGSKQ